MKKPYVRVDILRKDPLNMFHMDCTQWDKSNADIYTTKMLQGEYWVGLSNGRSLTSGYIEFVKEITEAGQYWVLYKVYRNPTGGDKTVSLSIDGSEVGTKNTNYAHPHGKYVDCGLVDLTTGDHTFRATFSGKEAWISHVIIYKMDLYSTEETGSRRLSIGEIEFTENAVNEMDTARITMAMLGEWYRPNENPASRIIFERTDHVTIWVGTDGGEIVPKFGGYYWDHEYSEEPGEITIICVDRKQDLNKRPVYSNFYIGMAPKSGDINEFPNLKFSSAVEVIRYLLETCEYGMNVAISNPHGFIKNFGDEDDFNSLNYGGFSVTQDPDHGHPAPGLRVGYEKLAANSCGVTPDLDCYLDLFTDPLDPFDVDTHNIIAFDYMVSGASAGSDYAVQFNVEVTVNDIVYTILFTGKAGAANVIGTVPYTFNGIFQTFKFDLKDALLKKKGISPPFLVTKISLTDTLTPSQAAKRGGSIIILDNPTSFEDAFNAHFTLRSEAAYPLEVLRDICNQMGYVLYMEPGPTRGEDTIHLAPIGDQDSEETFTTGINVLKVSQIAYSSVDDNFCTAAFRHYTYKVKNEDKTGKSYVVDLDKKLRYGPGAFEHYEALGEEIATQIDSDKNATAFLERFSDGVVGFTLEVEGTVLLTPANYAVTELAGYYLPERSEIKDIVHKIKFRESPTYTTIIDCGWKGDYFMDRVSDIEERLKGQSRRAKEATYNTNAAKRMGTANSSAYIRKGW